VQGGLDTPGLDDVIEPRLMGVGTSRDGTILYLAIADGMSRLSLARVLRYVGVSQGGQVGGMRYSANIYLHSQSDEGREVKLLASERDVEQGLTDYFYLVRSYP
jgi:hypothetical protein